MEKKIQDIRPIYNWIVDSVIAKARPHFLQDGVDESVLEDLKSRWEQKLEECNVFDAEEGVIENGKEDGEGANTPEDGSQPGEKGQEGDKASEPETKKRKMNPNAAEGDDSMAKTNASASGSLSNSQKDKDGELDEDLDDTELDEDLDDEEAQEDDVVNMVVAQYDKVVRNKNKWKCQMKHGIVHIDGREYVFSKGTGEFVFE